MQCGNTGLTQGDGSGQQALTVNHAPVILLQINDGDGAGTEMNLCLTVAVVPAADQGTASVPELTKSEVFPGSSYDRQMPCSMMKSPIYR